MRKVILFLLIVGLVGALPATVSARGGEGGGQQLFWLWNHDQQRLLRLTRGGTSYQADEVPLPLLEGYQFAGMLDLGSTTLLVCMEPDTTETDATDTMVGVYDYEAGQFLSEPKSFGGQVSCSYNNIFAPAQSYYIAGVMTATGQWNLIVLDVMTGEVVYSLSKDQADPDGTISSIPQVIQIQGNTVWLALRPAASETTVSEFPLVEWKMGDDHVQLLDTYPVGTQLLHNGEAIILNRNRDTIFYQSLNGTPYPIFNVPGFAIRYFTFIERSKKVLVTGGDADHETRIFVVDRTAGITELDSAMGGYLIPTRNGFASLVRPDSGGTEWWAIAFDEDGNEKTPVLEWSDPTSETWVWADYPLVGVELGLSPFLPMR